MSVLSKERRQQIRARADATTPGRWYYVPGIPRQTGDSYNVWAAQGLVASTFTSAFLREEDDRNGEFIANSKQDVPDLLDEVERLEAEVARLRGLVRESIVEEG